MVFSCAERDSKIDHFGKSLWLNEQNETLLVRTEKVIDKIDLKGLKGNIRNPKWSRSSDDFFLEVKDKEGYKNILRLDLSGNIVDSILKTRKKFDFYFPSLNDSLFLLGNFNNETKITKYLIYNYSKRVNIDSLIIHSTWYPQYRLIESPWDIKNQNILVITSSDKSNKLDEIYIYNISNKNVEFVSQGLHPSWSPLDTHKIAYHTEDKVHILNIKTLKDSVLYETPWRENISRLRWTPDGGLYFTCTGDRLLLKPFGHILSDKFYDVQINHEGHLTRSGYSVRLMDSWK